MLFFEKNPFFLDENIRKKLYFVAESPDSKNSILELSEKHVLSLDREKNHFFGTRTDVKDCDVKGPIFFDLSSQIVRLTTHWKAIVYSFPSSR